MHTRNIMEINEHDACGVGAIVRLDGEATSDVLSLALEALRRFEHRGGAIDGTGDGAGLLVQIDQDFFRNLVPESRRPAAGEMLGVATVFLPHGERVNDREIIPDVRLILRRHELELLHWRPVPVNPDVLGAGARSMMPDIVHMIFRVLPRTEPTRKRLFRARLELEDEFHRMYFASMSTDVVVYKALATSEQLIALYPDLQGEQIKTSLAVFHRRFSTNTISNWMLAQVFRFIAQNGEINSIRANRSAVKNLSRALGFPNVLQRQGSDSADFDRALELFMVHGMPLHAALRRMMPPASAELIDPPAAIGDLLEANRRVMGALGAFEGPAAIVASDGNEVVAALDRMGLRPLRYLVTHDGFAYVGSEVGAIPFELDRIARSGQLDPGEMIRIRSDLELPEQVHDHWIGSSRLAKVPAERVLEVEPVRPQRYSDEQRESLMAKFGWSRGDLQTLRHMSKESKEPITSMGWDRPLAALQETSPNLYDYFHQIIAVVTNPPIDPIREGGAMDLSVYLGRKADIEGEPETREPAQLRLASPVITNGVAAAIRSGIPNGPSVRELSTRVAETLDHREMERRLEERIDEAVRAVDAGEVDVLWFSDRGAYQDGRVPLPMLFMVGGVHNTLSRMGLRRKVSIVAETGDACEGHDIAVLLAGGADAVNPWLLFDAMGDSDEDEAVIHVHEGLDHSLRRIMSKMGITSIEGYIGSKLFECIGLSDELIDRYLRRTPSRVGGIDFAEIHRAIVGRIHREAKDLKAKPIAAYRKEVTDALQIVARGDTPHAYEKYLEIVRQTPPIYLRDLLEFRLCLQPLNIDEVETETEIIRNTFRGAAMSLGALSNEAHRAIAQAFNELGSTSNSGEGGEDVRRNHGGPWERYRSRIRQIASARFGVDAEYLVNADEIEIKIGQGAKPGEGGHLPAHKVTAEIARIRKTREGVALISPPPHHDIYSIEDLAQLIDSLRQTHPDARIGVKCPATTEIGTIAVGVAKAGADVIAVSGFEGGTGAAARSSIEHAGIPLERGLSEVHQALVTQGIRDRVSLRADGGIKTGLDVAKLVALGADSVSFGTLLMVAEQCIYCRGCMAGKCPTGITTHDPKYKKRFVSKILSSDAAAGERIEEAAKGVRMVLTSIAGELRQLLAALGLRSTTELLGRTDLLMQRRAGIRKLDTIDLSTFLEPLPVRAEAHDRDGAPLRPRAVFALNEKLLAAAEPALRETDFEPVKITFPIENTDRCVGATLAGRLARRYQTERFATGSYTPRSVEATFEGYAGQGFGFAAVDGMHLTLAGFANDTVAEVMSEGARIVVRPRQGESPEHIDHRVGNAAAYGATGGTLYIAGAAGQRLGVRNSGATIVAERAGKYAFEYMTDGVGILLSPSGPVIGSGMTGGRLFLVDEQGAAAAARRLHTDAGIAALEPADLVLLRDVLHDFVRATGSSMGRHVLDNLDVHLEHGRIHKVVPADTISEGQAAHLSVVK